MSEYSFGSMAYEGVPGADGGYGAGQPGGEPQQSQEPKWFRDRMEALAQQNQALADQVKSLTAERTRAQTAQAFEAAGVSPAAAALYQGDPGKVAEWLEANKAFLAPAEQAPQGQQAGAVADPAAQAAMQQMQAAGSGAGIVGPQGSDDELAAALRSAQTPEDFVSRMQAGGWQYTRDNLTY